MNAKMELYMKVNGKIIRNMDKEHVNVLMGFIQDSGNMINKMEQELLFIRIKILIVENGIKGIYMGKEFTPIQMEGFMKETGIWENIREKEL